MKMGECANWPVVLDAQFDCRISAICEANNEILIDCYLLNWWLLGYSFSPGPIKLKRSRLGWARVAWLPAHKFNAMIKRQLASFSCLRYNYCYGTLAKNQQMRKSLARATSQRNSIHDSDTFVPFFASWAFCYIYFLFYFCTNHHRRQPIRRHVRLFIHLFQFKVIRICIELWKVFQIYFAATCASINNFRFVTTFIM